MAHWKYGGMLSSISFANAKRKSSFSKTTLPIFMLFFFLIGSTNLKGQANNEGLNLRLAFVADIGSQFRRAGVLVQSNFVLKSFEGIFAFQLKTGKGYGPQKGFERTMHLGFNFFHGASKENIKFNSIYQPFHFSIRSDHRIRYGYIYNYYWDKSNTSQGTGTINIKIGAIHLVSENDLLGNTSGKDQFRTGAIGIYMLQNNLSFGLKTVLWTGQTRCTNMKRVKDENFRSRYGYKDISDCAYANYSHGILSFEGAYMLSDYIAPSLSLGRDDERIRNEVQNKIIHDLKFIPQKLNGAENPHIPMLDTEGKLYLYKEGQEIEKGKWLVQLGFNYGLFY